MSTTVVALIIVALTAAAVALLALWLQTRRSFTTPVERAAYSTLHTAALAARALRSGLTAESAAAAAPHLRALLGTRATGLTDAEGVVLAWDGPHKHYTEQLHEAALEVIRTGRRALIRVPESDDRTFEEEGQVRALVVEPLMGENSEVVGVLGGVTTGEANPGLVRAMTEVARYVGSQIELADLDASRALLASAEVRALRAQISPHFIYNALTTIASFVRTDPDRARDLVLEFADFTRYSFRTAGEFTTLSEELRNIDRYLTLERARFGSNLQVRLQVAPEVLGVVVPFLALQPLVENAVRHGISGKPGGGTITIVAVDEGTECVISVEDDGAGMDPEVLRTNFGAGEHVSADVGAHVGLANVDERLRAAFGNDYGLVVDTALGAGTKVSLRVPKFRAGVRR